MANGVEHVQRATALASEISEKCTEAMLEWGRAANKADASPNDAALKRLAQLYGQRALELAMGVARYLK